VGTSSAEDHALDALRYAIVSDATQGPRTIPQFLIAVLWMRWLCRRRQPGARESSTPGLTPKFPGTMDRNLVRGDGTE